MYVRKVIEVSFTLLPNQCYMGDNKETIISIFNSQYMNKCLACCYITKLLNILKVSPILMLESDLEGRGRINAIVVVEGIVYEPGEIVAGKVISINNDIYTLESENAIITLHPADDTPALELNTWVPVEVVSTIYNTHYSKKNTKLITIMGRLYTTKYLIYDLYKVDELSKSDINYLKKIVEYYDEKMDEIKTTKQVLSKIHNHLYSFKKQPKLSIPNTTNEKIHNLFDFDKFQSNSIVSRPHSIPRHEPKYISVKTDKPTIDMKAKDFLEYAIIDYYTYIYGTSVLSTYYNDTEYKKVSSLFKYYDKLKK